MTTNGGWGDKEETPPQKSHTGGAKEKPATKREGLVDKGRVMDLATAHGIEESEFFFAIVTKHWIMEPWHKDEIAYAKALRKPFALATEKGVDPGNWFDGCNVIGRITFDRDNLNDKGITDWLESVRDSLLKGK